MGKMTDDLWTARRDAHLVDVMRIIDEHGWAVQCVFATEASPGADFAYTVGLTALDRPELMVTGLPLEMAHDYLNVLADRGVPFTDGQRITDLVEGVTMVVVSGELDRSMPPTTACALYGVDGVRVQQIVWPDDDGLFPWDEGNACADMQPVIGRST